jgi:hypothetical protein
MILQLICIKTIANQIDLKIHSIPKQSKRQNSTNLLMQTIVEEIQLFIMKILRMAIEPPSTLPSRIFAQI